MNFRVKLFKWFVLGLMYKLLFIGMMMGDKIVLYVKEDYKFGVNFRCKDF